MLIPIIDWHQLIQILTFPTWHRLINNVYKSSIFNHIYLRDPNLVVNLNSIEPLIRDYFLYISFNLPESPDPLNSHLKEIGRMIQKIYYCKNSHIQFSIQILMMFNLYGTTLNIIVNDIVPYELFINNQMIKSTKPSFMKNQKLI